MAVKASQPADTDRLGGRTKTNLLRRAFGRLAVAAFLAVVLGIWQIAVDAEWISRFVLPAPTAIGQELWNIAVETAEGGKMLESFLLTVQEIVIGFLIAGVAGIGLGVAVAKTAFGRRVLNPVLIGLYAAPKVALAPLLVVWFGFGITAKFMLGALIAFFPVVMDTAAGLASTDPAERRLFEVLRANPVQVFMKLELPTALPFIFAGLRTASVLAATGAVVGELLAGGQGLGGRIILASSQLALDRVFAFVIILSLLAIALYILVERLERRLVYWRETRSQRLEH